MTNINVLDPIHKNWIDFFQKQRAENPLEYPTLKVFTAKKLKEVMIKEGHLSEQIKQ